jgi:hypothetical protein
MQMFGRGGLDDHLDLAIHDQLFVISDIGADDTGDGNRQCPDRTAAKQFFLVMAVSSSLATAGSPVVQLSA